MRRAYACEVAGCRVVLDTPLSELVPFRLTPVVLAGSPPASETRRAEQGGTLVYRGPGLMGEGYRQVACWSSDGGYDLRIAGVGAFAISRGSVALTEREPQATSDAVAEALLGPALILALALQGTWCLHASSVSYRGYGVAFLGESGRGKSTLAAYLGQQEGGDWSFLGDDTLPVAPQGGTIVAFPRYPQRRGRRLSLADHPVPERVPLSAVYVLREPAEDRADVSIEFLSPRRAVLALVRHTVASRLFDRGLLDQHLQFCTQAAAHLPVFALRYPRSYAALPRVGQAVAAHLGERLGNPAAR